MRHGSGLPLVVDCHHGLLPSHLFYDGHPASPAYEYTECALTMVIDSFVDSSRDPGQDSVHHPATPSSSGAGENW